MNTISKGSLYSFNDEYSIYQLYTDNAQLYYLSIPNKNIDNCQVYVGFPSKDLNTFTKDEFIGEVDTTFRTINGINQDNIYLCCPLSASELIEAGTDNDNKLYKVLLSKLHDVTKDTFNTLSKNNNVTISPVVYAIKTNNYDTKFIDWLEIVFNGFIDGVTFNSLKKQYKRQASEASDGNSDFGTRTNSGGTLTKSDVKVKKLVKPQTGKKGFSSFAFISLIIVIALFMGIGLAYLLIK